VPGSAMVILEINRRTYAAHWYVRVVEGGIRDGSEAEKNRRCYDKQYSAEVCS
jgi:hypothetical protein